MSDLKKMFENAIRNAKHDEDLADELVKLAEAHYEGTEDVSTEEKVIKNSPSQQAALDAAKAKGEAKK